MDGTTTVVQCLKRTTTVVQCLVGTTTVAQCLVVSLEKLHTDWWLIVCRKKKIGVDMVITGVHTMARDMVIICMPNQHSVVLIMVLLFLPFKPRETMFMKTYGLVLDILLEMLDITPDLQVPMTIVLGLAHIMRPTVETIVAMDGIIQMECSKMGDKVIPQMLVILSTWAKYQFHQLPISTSRIDITLLRAMNLVGLKAIRVMAGPLKTKMLEDIIIHILQEISSQLLGGEEREGHLQGIVGREFVSTWTS